MYQEKLTGAMDTIKLNLTGAKIEGRALAHILSSEAPYPLSKLYCTMTTQAYA
jgi:hypothetical protein